MNYVVQKPGEVDAETYSLDGLRAAVTSGRVQQDWQLRRNGEQMTVREALEVVRGVLTCYECGKQISSLATACPSCGAPPRLSTSLPLATTNSTSTVTARPRAYHQPHTILYS
jgi:hypothetical protein